MGGSNLRALKQAIKKDSSCLLDSSFVLAYLSGDERTSEVATIIVDDWISNGQVTALVSVITAMEAAVCPIKSNNISALRSVMDFLRTYPNLRLLPIDYDCAFEAARLRAISNMTPPDALILATGVLHNADAILTNDRSWKSKMKAVPNAPVVIYLEDFT